MDTSKAAARNLKRKAGVVGATLMGLGLLASATFLTAGPVGAKAHKTAHSNSCSAYKAGKNGVIRTFCTGPATVSITVGGTTTVIKGGTCAKSGPYFTVNAGVVTNPNHKGATPNYFGLDVPPTATSFTNAILTYDAGGTGGYASSNSGKVASNHKSGTFSGTGLQGQTVSGSFTC